MKEYRTMWKRGLKEGIFISLYHLIQITLHKTNESSRSHDFSFVIFWQGKKYVHPDWKIIQTKAKRGYCSPFCSFEKLIRMDGQRTFKRRCIFRFEIDQQRGPTCYFASSLVVNNRNKISFAPGIRSKNNAFARVAAFYSVRGSLWHRETKVSATTNVLWRAGYRGIPMHRSIDWKI